MKKIYIFRHGEARVDFANIRTIANPDLTDLGKKQAEMAGELLKNKDIRYLYSSDLNRAFETAEIVGKVINIRKVEKFLDLGEGGESNFNSKNNILNSVLKLCRSADFKGNIGIASHSYIMRDLLNDFVDRENSLPKNCEIFEFEYREELDYLRFVKRFVGI